jgi:hypothetical protein
LRSFSGTSQWNRGSLSDRNDSVKAMAVSKLDADLLNACLRLLAVAPVARAISGAGTASHSRDHLPASHRRAGPSHAPPGNGSRPFHRIVRAARKLRKDFAKPLRIEEFAREIGMSVSGFHSPKALGLEYRGLTRLTHHKVLFWSARHEQAQFRVAPVREALPCDRPL